MMEQEYKDVNFMCKVWYFHKYCDIPVFNS